MAEEIKEKIWSFINEIQQQYYKRKDEIIRTALIEKGFNPDDIESLKDHLICRTFPPEFNEHYYMDNVHIISIKETWKRI